MQIAAALVKELRERTGSGMMDCKKALQEAEGDIDAAIEAMRKSGVAKAAKRASRMAVEGLIVIKELEGRAVILEVNTETDFAAKDDDFRSFTESVADCVLSQKPDNLEALMQSEVEGQVLEEIRQRLIARIGENINVRRFDLLAANETLGAYLHGARIGVLVNIQGGDEALAKDLAMHIAASNPVCIRESEIPEEMLEKEREIFSSQAAESGKPENIIKEMIGGKMKKFIREITLLGQSFVKDADSTIEQLLKNSDAVVNNFIRYEVGEGMEKKADDFAEQVIAQARGA